MKWDELSFRERWLAIAAAGSFCLFLGAIAANIIPGGAVDWDGVTATTAVVALIVAIVGFLDNRRSQQLEHRAYVAIKIVSVEMDSPNRAIVHCSIRNYGRTFCDLRVQGSGEINRPLMPLGSGARISGGFSLDILHPGSEEMHEIFMECTLTMDLLGVVSDGNSFAHITCSFQYRDVFGVEHAEVVSASLMRVSPSEEMREVW